MRTSLLSLCILLVHAASLVGAASRATAEEASPAVSLPTPPVSPEESLQWFELSQDHTIELIAAEPQTIDPVAIAFDDSGDMWVVEMSDYPTGPPDGGEPLSRIRILRDEDLDGRYDTATTFVDGLSFANGLQLWQDGAIVTAAGQLTFFRDSDGDGVADQREVWFDGLAEQNPQLRANHPSIALDNWLYVANGLRTAAAIDRTSGAADEEPEKLNLSGRDLRIDMATLGSEEGVRAEAVTGPSQFGLTWDVMGRRYFCSNRNPCVEVAIEQREAALSPLSGITPLTRDVVPAGEASQVHPLVQAWTTSNLHAGQFTAACGVLVTKTDRLPEAPLGHSLVCEPTGHLVHHRALKREDARTQVADQPTEQEWLASYDNWFRPVNLSEGPDGAVYVVDMYRAVIEHPDFVPDELKNRPDARYGDDRGRIYRTGLLDRTASTEIFRSLREKPLGTRSTEELVALLKHPGEWMRRTAARLLLSRKSPQAIEALRHLATSDQPLATRLRAVYLLSTWRALEPAVMENLLEATDARLRTAAWQLLGHQPAQSGGFGDRAKAALGSSDLDEALAASWYLARTIASDEHAADGEAASAEEAKTADGIHAESVRLAVRHANDPYVLMAATAASRGRLDLWYQQWLMALAGPDHDSSVRIGEATWDAAERLARHCAAEPTEASEQVVSDLLRFAEQAAAGEADDADRQRLWLAVALGWASGGRRASLADSETLWDWVEQTASDERASQNVRLASLRLLAFAPEPIVQKLFPDLPEQLEDGVLTGAAVTAWSRHADERRIPWMIDRFTTATPRERVAIFDALLSGGDSLTALVEALEAGELKVRDFDASQIQRLGSSRNQKLRGRITKLLQGAVDPDRSAVLKKYATALEKDANPRHGAAMFVKHCAACHQIDGTGFHVGPDISDSRTQQPMQLLTAVLDPNRAIDNRYFRYLALTDDGRVVDGVLAEETADTITLVRQNAERVVIDREEIVELKPAGVSLMPEGLEAQISPQEMADLISYIKNWRYFKESAGETGVEGL